jgi:hypothetical protein
MNFELEWSVHNGLCPKQLFEPSKTPCSSNHSRNDMLCPGKMLKSYQSLASTSCTIIVWSWCVASSSGAGRCHTTEPLRMGDLKSQCQQSSLSN